MIEKDHLGDWNPEKDLRKPSSVSPGFKPFSYLVCLLLSTTESLHLVLSIAIFFQRSVVLPRDFPSEEVFEAYLHPVVDESTEQFEWGKPDLHSLRLYPL